MWGNCIQGFAVQSVQFQSVSTSAELSSIFHTERIRHCKSKIWHQRVPSCDGVTGPRLRTEIQRETAFPGTP